MVNINYNIAKNIISILKIGKENDSENNSKFFDMYNIDEDFILDHEIKDLNKLKINNDILIKLDKILFYIYKILGCSNRELIYNETKWIFNSLNNIEKSLIKDQNIIEICYKYIGMGNYCSIYYNYIKKVYVIYNTGGENGYAYDYNLKNILNHNNEYKFFKKYNFEEIFDIIKKYDTDEDCFKLIQ